MMSLECRTLTLPRARRGGDDEITWHVAYGGSAVAVALSVLDLHCMQRASFPVFSVFMKIPLATSNKNAEQTARQLCISSRILTYLYTIHTVVIYLCPNI